MKLSLAQIRQIQEYLEQGISIRKIATLCQVVKSGLVCKIAFRGQRVMAA